jgi:hypothetical protein
VRALDEPGDATNRAVKITRHIAETCDALLGRRERKTAPSRTQEPLFTRRAQGFEANAERVAGRRCKVV